MAALLKTLEQTPIIDKCLGCAHAPNGEAGKTMCNVYRDPIWKWELGQCNFATHIKKEAKKEAFINPLKAAKMRAKGLR